MLYQTKNPHGGDIYAEPIELDFSANTNPFGTPQGILDAVQASLRHMHRYPDPYCRQLVREICKFEQVPRQYILCGNGAAELIYTYCEAVKPRCALELAPTFSEYALGLRRMGCRVTRHVLKQSTGFEVGEDVLDAIYSVKPDVVFLCNPNNPTGRTVNPQLMKKILKVCRTENIRLFVDECFLDFTELGESVKPYLAETPQLMILKAFTKSYGMAGIRLGYCMSADSTVLHQMAEAVQPWNVSSLAQAAGIAALKEQKFLQDTKALVGGQRQYLRQELEKLGFWVCPAEANFLLFSGPEFLQERLKEKKIAIRNCDNYEGLCPGWYRIAVRLPEENKRLVEEISRIMHKE